MKPSLTSCPCSLMCILVTAGHSKAPKATWWSGYPWGSGPRRSAWSTSPRLCLRPETSPAPRATSQFMYGAQQLKKKHWITRRLMLSVIPIPSRCGYSQGLDDEYQEEGKLLGHYTYQEDGESLQSFPVMVTNEAFFSRYMCSCLNDVF